MNAPVNLREGKVLLLAGPESFNAAYIRRTLDFFGVPVLAPPGPASQAFASLDAADWLSVTACVAVDLGQALFADLSQQRRDVPFLFVGYDPGTWFPGPYAWLCPPFASYQVVEALGEMVSVAATAAMRASIDLATTDFLKPDATP
jgi:hypothetical protein